MSFVFTVCRATRLITLQAQFRFIEAIRKIIKERTLHDRKTWFLVCRTFHFPFDILPHRCIIGFPVLALSQISLQHS